MNDWRKVGLNVDIQDWDKYDNADSYYLLGSDAVHFICELVKEFGPRVKELLRARQERQTYFDNGGLPSFLPATQDIRSGDWKAAPLPKEVLDRRVEITGPASDAKMVINALNSGANVYMTDLEDSCSPTFSNIMQGHININAAIRGTISYTNEAGKEYKLNDNIALLMVRPRGWHLVEKHFTIDGEGIPAALFDFGLHAFHNMGVNRHLYLYLPKMESAEEARLWNDVFDYAEAFCAWGIKKPNTIKATCLIETITAAFEMDEIIWELKNHIVGLNTGRWDYLFSFIKKFAKNPNFILPDRDQIVMSQAFLDAYSKLLVQTCHRRSISAIGGMSALIGIKNDPAANDIAMEKVRADKLREVKIGCDGCWIAHPLLLQLVKSIFDEHMPQPNQILNVPDYIISEGMLLEPHQGTRTEEGLRHNIRLCIRYLESYLMGNGCVALYNMMEDLATFQVNYAICWSWIFHQVNVDDTPLTQERFLGITCEEIRVVEKEVGDKFKTGRFREAFGIFIGMCMSPTFTEFLPSSAYQLL